MSKSTIHGTTATTIGSTNNLNQQRSSRPPVRLISPPTPRNRKGRAPSSSSFSIGLMGRNHLTQQQPHHPQPSQGRASFFLIMTFIMCYVTLPPGQSDFCV
mmetsp:Transcript_38027/g.38430  ORF Transcript_38027/g.38430 Transcript_38027/m.38430 type:complete len:101 (+) Transcript_38027:172-474(+)